MLARNLGLFLLVTALVAVSVLPAGATQMTLEQAEIPQISTNKIITTINPDYNGYFTVSHEFGQIWKINPITGEYTYYDLYYDSLTDAQREGNDRYWFTNGGNEISFTSLLLHQTTTWSYDPGPNSEDYQFGAIAVESPAHIWVANSFGAQSKLYLLKFTQSDGWQMCPLTGAYTSRTFDIVIHNGSLWFYNYEEVISRLNLTPAAQGYELTSWSVPISNEFQEGRVIDFDNHNLLWIPGGGTGGIMSFDPTSKSLITYDVPGEGASIEGVAALYDQIYYADHNGSVGILDPDLAPKVSIALADPSTTWLTLSCDEKLSLPIVMSDWETNSGTLQFSPHESVPDTSHPGWTIYPLTPNDELYGISAALGTVFISDSRIGVGGLRSSWLLRLQPEPDNSLFLPMIRK